MTSPIRPFKISVPDSKIQGLRDKLAVSSFPESAGILEDWDAGVPLGEVKRLADHWRNGFDWRAQEAKLNEELPQFTTDVEVEGFGEINVHFIHARNAKEGSIPLLFCHGWPGSFLEVVKILPLLLESDDPTFHVVAPSLPNFGFSDRVTEPGFSCPQYAECLHKLMLKLGYKKYVAQGGDWGFSIVRALAADYPQSCLAQHLNYAYFLDPPGFLHAPLDYIKAALFGRPGHEKAGLERSSWFMNKGFGYNLEQSTKPSTIGIALADSPVALLAWVYEKLHDWTDDYGWTDDEILTWISIYHFSKAGAAASVRIYYERAQLSQRESNKTWQYNPIALGISYFPRDIFIVPSAWGKTLGPVVFEKRHESGGHFAAYERPQLLVEDLRTMFGKRGGASGIAGRFDKRE